MCPNCGKPHPRDGILCPSTDGALKTTRPAPLAIGELLDGKYQIEREIGRGAMGVVYEGVHVTLHRRVAVKTLLQEMTADAQLGARFEREARAASAIGHPHIVDVFDLGRTSDGLLFMVMELLDGESLAAILEKTPCLPIPLAIHLMVQVLSGLSAAHKNGIVHRDLKPDNIFVLNSEDRPNFVKIVDFGISKTIGPQGANPSATAKFAGTMVGAVLGTPLYMSPEQAIGQVAAIDHRTDIYSAGVVLYEMLCGRTPYDGESYPQILGALLEGAYPPPRSLRPDMPVEVEAAIVCALDRNLSHRFPTAAAMRNALAKGSQEMASVPLPMSGSWSVPVPLSPSESGEPRDEAPSSIFLRDDPPAPADTENCPRKARATSGDDLFAPPPDPETSPLLDRDLGLAGSPGLQRASDTLPAVELARPARQHGGSPKTASQSDSEPLFSAQTRSRLVKVLLVLTLLAAGRLAYGWWRRSDAGTTASQFSQRPSAPKIRLTLVPPDASVQIDHIPTGMGELPIDSGSPRTHLLNATAPGRLTRRFSFSTQAGMDLNVHLGHTLPLPTPTDPPPLPAEAAATIPEQPRAVDDIEDAFAKLGRYADCLAATVGPSTSARKSDHARLADERCQRRLREASAMAPPFPSLASAAEAYWAAKQAGQKRESTDRKLVTFRAELLAARAPWQLEELAREGVEATQASDKGQTVAWHMRSVALAAQAWYRALKTVPFSVALHDDRRAHLNEVYQALVTHSQNNQQTVVQMPGGSDFMRAAQELLALVPAQGMSRRPSEAMALDACRRLLTAFNALVVD